MKMKKTSRTVSIMVIRIKSKIITLKQIVKKYPNIKFEIVTNGIYATKENIESLGIQNNIENIKFSKVISFSFQVQMRGKENPQQ